MCGIFGVFAPKKDSSVEGIINKSGKEVLNHRGPDNYDYFKGSCSGAAVYLDHNRLSIIGLGPQGRQPFCNRDESVAITYNGEIYNYRSLRNDLSESYEWTFETDTDTEVLLKSYETWGLEKTLSKVVGMFAFGIVDLNRGTAYVARDQLGIKPVYYAGSSTLMFASEAKALLERGGLDASLNKDVLGEYLANFWVHEPDTLFEGIYKLEAGHYLSYDLEKKEFSKTKYWDIVGEESTVTEDLSDIGIDIEKVVQEQLISDVPLGVYLSGGIDSSVMAYHAVQDKPITALNLRNDTDEADGEYRNIERLEEQIDVEIESIYPDASMLDVYRKMIYHMDEPIADTAIIPAYLLARAAREKDTKVMLSGMGGDEIFAGYRRMHVVANIEWLQYLAPVISLVDRLLPEYASRFRRNVTQIANFLNDPSPTNYFSLSNRFSRDEISDLTEDKRWYDRYVEKVSQMLSGKQFIDEAQRYQYLDIRGFLASHNLIYMDKASMAESVEVRVPFLDHRFAKKYFNIPTDRKVSGGLKSALKRHLSDILGDEFIGHDKQGFAFPIDGHLEKELKDDLNSMLNDDKLGEIIDTGKLEQMIEDQFSGHVDNAMKIWAIYTLWLWLNEFNVKVN